MNRVAIERTTANFRNCGFVANLLCVFLWTFVETKSKFSWNAMFASRLWKSEEVESLAETLKQLQESHHDLHQKAPTAPNGPQPPRPHRSPKPGAVGCP